MILKMEQENALNKYICFMSMVVSTALHSRCFNGKYVECA